ncbi:DUF2169 domain-containing protein [Sorangium sp. So ce1036]|uniref:DUF2169 family type VI secretion system accessory protein n=1 Tax=Sorangium sp. So ce1036 TaxID=3133328 RepID=UPI003F097B2A
MTTARWPLDVFHAGPVAAGATLWRSRGQLHVTIVAKATFAMVPGGDARQIDPLDVVRGEIHARGNPMSPLVAASELAPWLERAEVVLTGHAWAPGGAPVRRMPVRLAILRGAAALVDKRLEVVGDRTAVAGAPSPEPEPFVKMPIEYQRAWGGPGDPENPFGVGGLEDTGGRTPLPNVLPPDGRRAPIGLGPIPSIVPSRTRLLRGLARAELEGVASIPDGFDWSYYQSAPADQRFDRVLGGEQIVLEGLRPHHPALTTRLPPLRALATIHLPNGAARSLPLPGDMLIVQSDAGRCAVVFRGSFQVASAQALATLRVAVGVAVGGQPVPWPDVTEVLARAPVAGAMPEGAKAADWSSTVRLEDDDIEDVTDDVAVAQANPLDRTLPLERTLPPQGQDAVRAPFPIAPAGTHGDRESGAPPEAPWAAGRASVVPASGSPLAGTIDMLAGTIEVPAPVAAPARGAAHAPEATPAPEAAHAPEATPAPEAAHAPEATPAPEAAHAPEATPAPEAAHAPEATPAPEAAHAPAPVAAPAPAFEMLPTPDRGPPAERSPGQRAPAAAPPAPKRERPDLVGSLYRHFHKR